MYNGMEIAAVIAAAGKGSRMGGPVPKQYLKIGGVPVLLRTLEVFSKIDEIDHIVIVAGEEHVAYCESLIGEAGLSGKVRAVVKGCLLYTSRCV